MFPLRTCSQSFHQWSHKSWAMSIQVSQGSYLIQKFDAYLCRVLKIKPIDVVPSTKALFLHLCLPEWLLSDQASSAYRTALHPHTFHVKVSRFLWAGIQYRKFSLVFKSFKVPSELSYVFPHLFRTFFGGNINSILSVFCDPIIRYWSPNMVLPAPAAPDKR